jgi:hypothetical protein
METESDDETAAAEATGKCFTPLQSRPFWAPVVDATVALCPSMDLLTLSVRNPSKEDSGTTTSEHPSSLWLHRSLDFRQLAMVQGPQQITATTWRPDGRWLAVADQNPQNKGSRLTLYHVEAMMTHGVGLTAHTDVALMGASYGDTADVAASLAPEDDELETTTTTTALPPSSSITSSGNIVRFQVISTPSKASDKKKEKKKTAEAVVQHLAWVHCVAPTTGDSLYERLHRKVNHNLAGTDILPPSAYNLETNPDYLPTPSQPLSALVALTQGGRIYAYLLGQYPLVKDLPSGLSTMSPHIRFHASHDMSHWCVYEHRGRRPVVAWHSFPHLGQHRYTLQSIAVLYTLISGHLHKMPEKLKELREAYQSSLKPMDTKWEALLRILKNYGYENEPIPKLLTQYVVLGYVSCAEDLENAIDIFFTSMPMNEYVLCSLCLTVFYRCLSKSHPPLTSCNHFFCYSSYSQLIQRMDRSLTVAIANVESLLRQFLAACQALFVQTDALLGLVQASSTPQLMPTYLVLLMHQSVQRLVLSTEACLSDLVETRLRLKDWVAWMRAMGSTIKARGTDANSALRENAKKRRISDATLQRILKYLQEALETSEAKSDDKTDPKESSGNISDRVMGLKASQFWSKTRSTVEGRPDLWTLSYALEETYKATTEVFRAPLNFLTNHMRRKQWLVGLSSWNDDGRSLLNEKSDCLIAVTARQGALWNSPEGAPDNTGCFVVPSEPRTTKEHQWTLIAEGLSDASQVNLYALPVVSSIETLDGSGEPVWDEFDFPEDDDETMGNGKHDDLSPLQFTSMQSYYLTASLKLPDDCRVVELIFFGDDGKSTLYSSVDKPIQEQRQGLGMIVKRQDSLELWVVPRYDQCHWETRQTPSAVDPPVDNDQTAFRVVPLQACQGDYSVVEGHRVPIEDDEEEEATTTGTVRAKVRVLSNSSTADPRLFVSGSRGIAAVVENQSTHARVGIWDLNEDEEGEEEDDDGEPAMETDATDDDK